MNHSQDPPKAANATARKKILLVEDDPDILESLAFIFETEGYAVMSATNGREALDALQSMDGAELPGLIVVDLLMPVMDGKAFCAEFRGRAAWRGIPVIMMTAGRALVPELVKEPVREVLLKPMDAQQIVAAVRKHFG